MALIDLFASNPYKHNIEDKVMGYHIFRCFRFICGNIIDREHRGESNVYIIESAYGKDFSGELSEGSIMPYDEKLVLEEIRRTAGDDKDKSFDGESIRPLWGECDCRRKRKRGYIRRCRGR